MQIMKCNTSFNRTTRKFTQCNTWSATAYKIAMIQGRQQQTAIPTMHATATHITTKNTSNAKNVMQSLHTRKNVQ